jgi:alkylated DNA repair dioxygenase AlkB
MTQLPLQLDSPPQHVLLEGGELLHWPGFIEPETASGWLKSLETETCWEQSSIQLFGQSVLIPRLNAWYGDPDCTYTYSGHTLQPQSWTPTLQAIRVRVEAVAETRYNSVLLNWYRRGADGVSWHADDEPELVPRHTIASLSLGGTRRFQLKPKRDCRIPNLNLDLAYGDLLLMRSTTQENWLHQIPKTRRPVAPRINLTFRVIRG